MENPIRIDDLGWFRGTPILGNHKIISQTWFGLPPSSFCRCCAGIGSSPSSKLHGKTYVTDTQNDTQEHSEESANIFKKECLSVADPYSTFQIWGFLAHFEHCTCLINPGCLQIEKSAWKLFPSGRCVDSHFEPSFPQDCECCDPPAQSFLCPAKACANHWFFGERTHQKKTEKNQWHLQIHPSQSQRCHHEADRWEVVLCGVMAGCGVSGYVISVEKW